MHAPSQNSGGLVAEHRALTRTPSKVQSDRALMGQILAGNDGAFESLYRLHSTLLFSVIFHILRDQAEAEDVLQETFVHMWRRAASYDAERASLFTWSVMIARNRAIDRIRSRQRYWLATDAAAVENILHAGNRIEEKADRRFLREEERDRVQCAMRQIDDAQREAILLAFFSGLTHSEIAQHLNAPLGTVNARIRRGLCTLRDALAVDR